MVFTLIMGLIMSKTKTELGTLALQMLKAVDGDATPETNDTTVIEAGYDEVYAKLVEKHLVSWGPTDSIPDKAVMPVAYLTAESRLALFTPPQLNVQLILAGAGKAIGDLTEVYAMDYVHQTIPSEPL